MSKIVKIREIIEALEKNGYPWYKGGYFKGDAYCAVSQAALNLGFNPEDDNDETFKFVVSGIAAKIRNRFKQRALGVMDYNDHYATSYEDVVNYVKRNIREDSLDEEVVIG